MGFYQEIAKYYDIIFPTSKNQLKLISETAGRPPKEILDIACGTGTYSIPLAQIGYNVTAVDLDAKMIELTKQKAELHQVKINALEANMLHLTFSLSKKYSTIFCIGNSIAHLNNLDEISQFFNQTYELLEAGGQVIFQIINFDRIIDKQISELPTIQDEGQNLSFKRQYVLSEEQIMFNTTLTVNDEVYNNSIPLYPIQSIYFIQLLVEAQFSHVETFGNFNQDPFDPAESYHLIVRATK